MKKYVLHISQRICKVVIVLEYCHILSAIDIASQLTGVPSKYHRSVIITFVKGHRLSHRQVQHTRFITLLIASVAIDWFSLLIDLLQVVIIMYFAHWLTFKFQCTFYTLSVRLHIISKSDYNDDSKQKRYTFRMNFSWMHVHWKCAVIKWYQVSRKEIL